MAKKRFDIITARPKQDGGTWWHKIGAAYESDGGGMVCYLDSIPMANEKGQVSFLIREAKDMRETAGTAPRQSSGRASAPVDDHVPF